MSVENVTNDWVNLGREAAGMLRVRLAELRADLRAATSEHQLLTATAENQITERANAEHEAVMATTGNAKAPHPMGSNAESRERYMRQALADHEGYQQSARDLELLRRIIDTETARLENYEDARRTLERESRDRLTEAFGSFSDTIADRVLDQVLTRLAITFQAR